jgi:hypothetical protein
MVHAVLARGAIVIEEALVTGSDLARARLDTVTPWRFRRASQPKWRGEVAAHLAMVIEAIRLGRGAIRIEDAFRVDAPVAAANQAFGT